MRTDDFDPIDLLAWVLTLALITLVVVGLVWLAEEAVGWRLL